MNIALSDADLRNALRGKVNILSYADLANYSDVSQILSPYGQAIILYINSDNNYGHWTSLIKHPDRVEFFDPYGGPTDGKPDGEFKYIDKVKRHKYNFRGKPYLSTLLANYAGKGGKVEYNEHPLQAKSSSVSTCGRWALARILTKSVNLDEFAKMMSAFPNKDETIVKLTKPLLKK